ncbi:hypothetical protein GI584_08750 [Gracilibacillus salitolerans]|uniref:Uncharacterized protein n=1 Tax=Gracilibacillus salitolerans TaxID=2663022 RepID=A0A5Q2TJC2_9BACI|nr:hypothetical protein [Gracilibacillus salitolerans]QGH34103.1 hypothetical protein GI584_08750 [Gracilibacillus salitolerans]
MEVTYRIMLYGGIVGALITLSIAIWLFIKLDIRHVLEDLTGIRLGKNRRKQNNASFEMWSERNYTSSQLELKKLEHTSESVRESRKFHTSQEFLQHKTNQQIKNTSRDEQISVSPHMQYAEPNQLSKEENSYDPTELLDEVSENNQTELLEETTFLENETELLGEGEASFEMEEEVIVTHNASNKKEGLK